jgi:hypothetical protein
MEEFFFRELVSSIDAIHQLYGAVRIEIMASRFQPIHKPSGFVGEA